MSDEVKIVTPTEEVALGLLAFALKLAPTLIDLFLSWKKGEADGNHPLLPHVDEIIGKESESHKFAEELRLLRDASDKL